MNKPIFWAVSAAWVLMAFIPWPASAAPTAQEIERGRYMVAMGGCNDCHTAGYLESESKIPEKDWLLGGVLGWRGPWGTTYAPNLRMTLANMTEGEWVKYARELKRRPTMPFWVLNTMAETDLKAIYLFIRSLGPVGGPAPAYLPPDVEPKPPYFQLVLPPAPK